MVGLSEGREHIKSDVAHDHIVLLLKKQEFENPPAWLKDNFNIIEGGTHTGGSSQNKLIIFKDGTYLELFTWIDEPKEFLAWADKPPGLIDFALTTLDPITAEDNYNNVTKRLERLGRNSIGVNFQEPKAGGRKRVDGKDVKWKTTRPEFGVHSPPLEDKYLTNTRLDIPFFCHDVTDRTVRVPFDNEKITTHPCGAVGIYSVNVVVPNSHFSDYLEYYGALLGTSPQTSVTITSEKDASFELSAPNPNFNESRSFLNVCRPAAEIQRNEEHENQEKWLRERGPGIYELILTGKQQESPPSSVPAHGLGTDAIGTSIRLMP